MRHKWAIRRLESELNTIKAVIAGNERVNKIDSAVTLLIAENIDLGSLPDGTPEERAIKNRVSDVLRTLDATKPFGDARVEARRKEVIDLLLSKVAWYEQRISEDHQQIAELEETLALLKADQPQAQAA